MRTMKNKSIDPKQADDRLMMRAKKPFFKKTDRSLSLNFNGRVKMASRKNIQIDYKYKTDSKIRVAL